MNLGSKIRQIIDRKGLTLGELARLSRVDVKTLYAIVERDSVRSKFASQIAAALEVSVEEILSDTDEDSAGLSRQATPTPPVMEPRVESHIPVRLVRFKVSAGVSGYAVDYLEGDNGPIYFRADWLRSRGLNPERLFAVKVAGASMEPTLYDGDLVTVNTEDTEPREGEVFAANYEGEIVIKRLQRDEGTWWLTSDAADQRRFQRKRCDEHVQLIGRVVHRSSERL